MNLLLAEDDKLTRTLLAIYLEEKGFQVFQASSLLEVEQILKSQKISIAVLDQHLQDGETIPAFFDICEDPSLKVICITSNTNQQQKNQTISTGIQNYILKPVNEDELFLRITAITGFDKTAALSQLPLGDKVRLDIITESLVTGNQSIKLTGTEVLLLKLFAENISETFTRDALSLKILARQWQTDDRSIDVLVGRIRKKMQQADCSAHIISVRGKGYRLEVA